MRAFDIWLQREVAQGLVGLHLSVRTAPGCTSRKVKRELLRAERAIARGQVRQAPAATSGLPGPMASFIRGLAL